MPTALLTFHHLLSSKKILLLNGLSRTHSISGIYKRGRPGVLLVSGTEDSRLWRFVKDVKRMRWQTVLLRGYAPGLSLDFPARRGLGEVEKVRDVVAVARELGEREEKAAAAAGETVEMWVVRKLGFVVGED